MSKHRNGETFSGSAAGWAIVSTALVLFSAIFALWFYFFREPETDNEPISTATTVAYGDLISTEEAKAETIWSEAPLEPATWAILVKISESTQGGARFQGPNIGIQNQMEHELQINMTLLPMIPPMFGSETICPNLIIRDQNDILIVDGKEYYASGQENWKMNSAVFAACSMASADKNDPDASIALGILFSSILERADYQAYVTRMELIGNNKLVDESNYKRVLLFLTDLGLTALPIKVLP